LLDWRPSTDRLSLCGLKPEDALRNALAMAPPKQETMPKKR
jgi:hypothetical protein